MSHKRPAILPPDICAGCACRPAAPCEPGCVMLMPNLCLTCGCAARPIDLVGFFFGATAMDAALRRWELGRLHENDDTDSALACKLLNLERFWVEAHAAPGELAAIAGKAVAL